MQRFSSHCAGKFLRGTVLCLTEFLVPKIFIVKRGEWEGTSRFFMKQICPTLPKSFVEEPFCVLLENISQGKKFMHKRGRKYQIFTLFFCPTVPKRFVEEPFSVSLILILEKLFG